jgi:glycosyltransferase involved in cell wall biosynthesis
VLAQDAKLTEIAASRCTEIRAPQDVPLSSSGNCLWAPEPKELASYVFGGPAERRRTLAPRAGHISAATGPHGKQQRRSPFVEMPSGGRCVISDWGGISWTGVAMRINVLYDRYRHHATRSGYPLLAEAVSGHADVRRLASGRPPVIPDRLTRWMAVQSGMPQYGQRSAEMELAVAGRLALGLPEVCHFFYAEQNFRFAAAMSPTRRGAIVCTYHQPREFFDWLVPDPGVPARADAVVVVSEDQAQFLRETVPADRVHVVPLGIDTAYYRPGMRRPSQRIIFVGEHRRDFDALFEVAECLRDLAPELELDVISTAERVAALKGLPNVTARSGVSDEELVGAYRSADVLLLPLLSATANNALLESMSCGLPVVASDVGGVHEYVDRQCATLVEPGDTKGMVHAVLDIIGDRSRRERMGLASRKRALSFDWARVAERQLDVYRETLAQPRVQRNWDAPIAAMRRYRASRRQDRRDHRSDR